MCVCVCVCVCECLGSGGARRGDWKKKRGLVLKNHDLSTCDGRSNVEFSYKRKRKWWLTEKIKASK